ncbi:hypothetical protein HOF40_04315 [Candidatus Parcubacteria bacterium]|jgi:hypothetical protein|nr:hypothetical protein [Candidatus Parcubacteria bacterium]MBT3949287.1 hypothetical protein [Candidatus Parcubacteria bacterium]
MSHDGSRGFEEATELEKLKVIHQLRLLLQKAHQLGNNDWEGPYIESIISQVEAGEIEPQLALRQAQEMIDGKNLH